MTSVRSQAPALYVFFNVSLGVAMVVPLLALYQERIGFSNGTFTALFSMYGAALLIPQIFVGTISDQIGRKPVVIPAFVMAVLGTVLHLVAEDSLALLFIGRALHGFGIGIFLGNMTAYVMDLGPDDKRDQSSRKAGMIHTLGFAVGPVLSGAVSDIFDDSVTLPWIVHLALLTPALFILLALPETIEERSLKSVRPRLGLPPGTRRPFFLFSAPAGFALVSVGTLGVGTLPLFMRQEVGLTSTFSAGLVPGILVAVSAAMQVRTEDLYPAQTARLGLVMLGGGLLLAASAPYLDAQPLIFIGAAVVGAGNGLALGSTLALSASAAPPDARGSVMSTFFLLSYSGYVAPVVYGYSSLSLGVKDTFLGFAAGFCLLAWFVATVGLHASGLVRKRPAVEREPSTRTTEH